jgi:hypothetical protein
VTADDQALKDWLAGKPQASQDMIRVMLMEGRRADLSTAEMVRAAEDALELFLAIHGGP